MKAPVIRKKGEVLSQKKEQLHSTCCVQLTLMFVPPGQNPDVLQLNNAHTIQNQHRNNLTPTLVDSITVQQLFKNLVTPISEGQIPSMRR